MRNTLTVQKAHAANFSLNTKSLQENLLNFDYQQTLSNSQKKLNHSFLFFFFL